MLGMLQSIQELHENDIVHRDIKPDNFLIDNDPEFQIFFRNYKYCIKRNDVSNSRPSPNNKYINSSLKLTSGDKYWDIYSAALIILEYLAGRGKFKFINEKKQEAKKRVEAFLKKFVQNIEIKKLLYKVLVKHDPEVQISDLLQCFYSLAK
ncbi:AUR protein kinase [Oxytricha trifallax]|uniref:AUR protein kinase n=1 Tax=Oxytricha trifallax TaxID=1172189 RepID=A0A073HYW8_9SPIT|nr:AUR protein kinase [Oxytricha trifallax]